MSMYKKNEPKIFFCCRQEAGAQNNAGYPGSEIPMIAALMARVLGIKPSSIGHEPLDARDCASLSDAERGPETGQRKEREALNFGQNCPVTAPGGFFERDRR